MTKEEMINIASSAIRKNLGFETLRYSDYMYGKEDLTEEVYDYVIECQEIGSIEFNKKYAEILKENTV